ncbi:MAG TPA: prephenate dehydrogenase/arogenate dehydrogenase family protein [Polyangiaceae bacterium]
MKGIAIVGLGLIGGSIAKAMREQSNHVEIVAVDQRHVLEQPDVTDTIDCGIEISQVGTNTSKLAKCDLIVLCQPVGVIADSVASYLLPQTIVTDTGSTKRRVVERAGPVAESRWFVPGHPMAGRARGGFENASARLFEGRPWIICPEDRATEAVAGVSTLIDLLGARRVDMTPEQHDAAVAITSHAPQLFSSWLQRVGSENEALAAAGPAFTEMTRTAGGAEAIWRDIFETNSDEVGRVLRDAAMAFAACSDALLSRPPRVDVVLDMLSQARQAKRANHD